MAATIKDIAKRLNISVSTVSYALNGGPRSVPNEVRDRVCEVARELDYRPNRLARSLATGRSHTIGVVPTEPIRDLAGMNYFHAVFNGVVNAAEDALQDVMLFTRADASRAEALDTLLDGRVDGLIVFSPRFPSVTIDKLIAARLPFAAVSVAVPGVPSFTCDNLSGVEFAVEQLIAKGHRKIGHLAGRLDLFDGIERLGAFRAAMARHGLEVREEWIAPAHFTIQGGKEAAALVLNQADRPTALFVGNDESAFGAIQWASTNGFSVPQDLSVVGFDDAEFSAYLTPGLTTVRQPLEEMGADALRAIVNLIEGRTAESKSYPPRLIERSSTAPAPKSNEG